ncbi:MAG: cupredoxin domain-containing protein [Pyrinomonadaceae bacterium]|nr:cupredoxin domain-containing protein [Pyrinomonadaceae bacterium]
MRNIYLKMAFAMLFAAAFTMTANAQSKSKPRSQSARVEITEQGYSPASVSLRRGVPASLTFIRLTDRTCGTEIVIPDHGINRPLPLNRPVVVRLTPKRTGTLGFTCGMNMMRGKLIVR